MSLFCLKILFQFTIDINKKSKAWGGFFGVKLHVYLYEDVYIQTNMQFYTKESVSDLKTTFTNEIGTLWTSPTTPLSPTHIH